MPQRRQATLTEASNIAAALSVPVHDSCRFPLGCKPAITLMFIDDSDGLHEGVADSRSDEAEAALLEILAHRIADGGRRGDGAQVQRPAAHHPAAREIPKVIIEGVQRATNLEVRLGIADESVHLESIPDDSGIL